MLLKFIELCGSWCKQFSSPHPRRRDNLSLCTQNCLVEIPLCRSLIYQPDVWLGLQGGSPEPVYNLPALIFPQQHPGSWASSLPRKLADSGELFGSIFNLLFGGWYSNPWLQRSHGNVAIQQTNERIDISYDISDHLYNLGLLQMRSLWTKLVRTWQLYSGGGQCDSNMASI